MTRYIQASKEVKKQLVLEAALQEFALHGYKDASTNSIIQTAQVSKGLLFHYFGSKEKLYLQVLDYCLKHFGGYFDKMLPSSSPDFIDRIIQINLAKLELAVEYPLMQKLVTEAFLDPPGEIKEEIESRQQEISQAYLPLLQERVDYSLFKEDIDQGQAIQLVIMVTESLGEKYIKHCLAKKQTHGELLSSYIKELKIYLDLLKKGIYRTTSGGENK